MTGLAEARRTSSASDQALDQLEQHRRELTGFCYRMLGSAFDAEDAVQETLVRAWKGFERFEGRSSVRSWLYRIATNVCLTMLEQSGRRAVPMDFGTPSEPVMASLGEPRPEATWVTPVPDDRIELQGNDPAEVAVARESVRLAFVAALQHLPPRQRAVLILREVLRWKADEVAELLGTSTASVNSALQRARATMAAQDVTSRRADPLDQEHAALLAGYVDAFERYDMDSGHAAPRRRDPEHAALRAVVAGSGRRGAVDAGPGQRVPGLAAGAGPGQRRSRPCPVPPQRSGRAARTVGPARDRDRRRSDRGSVQLPGHSLVRALRSTSASQLIYSSGTKR